MNRYLTILYSLILACVISNVVYAAPDDPDGYLTDSVIIDLRDFTDDKLGVTTNDLFWQRVWNNGFNPQDNKKLFAYYFGYQCYYYISDDLTIDNNNVVTVPSGSTYVSYNGRSGESSVNSAFSTFSQVTNNEYYWLGAYSDNVISEYFFDYSIPTFTGGVNSVITEYSESPCVPLRLIFNSQSAILNQADPIDYTAYRIEVKIRYALPTLVSISKVGGGYNYDYSGFVWSDWKNLWTYEDNKHLTALNYKSYKIDLPLIQSDWTDLHQNNEPTFTFNYNDTIIGKTALQAIYFQQSLFAGINPNKFDIYVRFCKMEDNNINYGRWTHFTNGNIQVLDPPAQSINEIPQNLPSGVSILDNDQVDDQIDNNRPDPYIINDINIQTNMPDQNTLNYPTIVSYNKDVVFQEWAGFAERIPNFFTSITAFATMAFSFIPSEIWAIIGMGLVLSIAVMVLKIL